MLTLTAAKHGLMHFFNLFCVYFAVGRIVRISHVSSQISIHLLIWEKIFFEPRYTEADFQQKT
jgi:hypothetical protein